MKKISGYSAIALPLFFLIVCGGCGSSSPGSGGSSPAGTVTAPLLTQSSQHAKGLGWQRKDCFGCHPLVKLADMHKRAPLIWNGLNALGGNVEKACMGCHGTNGLSAEEGGIRRCLICHGDANILSNVSLFNKTTQHDITRSGGLNDAACLTCHERSDMNGVFDISVDLTNFGTTYTTINDFCLSCHNANGAAGIIPPALNFINPGADFSRAFLGIGATDADRKATADIHGFGDGGAQLFASFRGTYTNRMVLLCTECHNVHSSNNPWLITESGSTATMTDDTAKSASVSVTSHRFNQLCALCHTNPAGADAGNGLKEVVHSFSTGSCVGCHYHGSGTGINHANRLF